MTLKDIGRKISGLAYALLDVSDSYPLHAWIFNMVIVTIIFICAFGKSLLTLPALLTMLFVIPVAGWMMFMVYVLIYGILYGIAYLISNFKDALKEALYYVLCTIFFGAIAFAFMFYFGLLFTQDI